MPCRSYMIFKHNSLIIQFFCDKQCRIKAICFIEIPLVSQLCLKQVILHTISDRQPWRFETDMKWYSITNVYLLENFIPHHNNEMLMKLALEKQTAYILPCRYHILGYLGVWGDRMLIQKSVILSVPNMPLWRSDDLNSLYWNERTSVGMVYICTFGT